jgi:hypothetical protein
MFENVGASTSRNPKGLHGLYRDNFNFSSENLGVGVINRGLLAVLEDSDIQKEGRIPVWRRGQIPPP